MPIQTWNEPICVSHIAFYFTNVLNNNLHFLLREPNNRQSLHHSFPIILVADRADPGAVSLNKTSER